jgi:hypothetical protein
MKGEGDAEMAAEVERLKDCYNVSAGRLLPCLPRKTFLKTSSNKKIIEAYNTQTRTSRLNSLAI